MSDTPFDRASDAHYYADLIVPRLEKSWSLILEADSKILQEAYLRADHTLLGVELDAPNHLKQAAHVCFWIRKLKPLKVFRTQSFQDAFVEMQERGLIRGELYNIDHPSPPPRRSIYINEIFALLVAIGIIADGGDVVDLNKWQVNDLAVSLRYHSFSPNALAAIIGAHVRNSGH